MKENHRAHAHGNSKVLCFSDNGVLYEVLWSGHSPRMDGFVDGGRVQSSGVPMAR